MVKEAAAIVKSSPKVRLKASSIDSFVIAASPRSDVFFYLTDEKLTLYKVHGAGTSTHFPGRGPKAYTRLIKYLLAF